MILPMREHELPRREPVEIIISPGRVHLRRRETGIKVRRRTPPDHYAAAQRAAAVDLVAVCGLTSTSLAAAQLDIAREAPYNGVLPVAKATDEKWAIPPGDLGRFVRVSNAGRVRIKNDQGHFKAARPRTCPRSGYKVVTIPSDLGPPRPIQMHRLFEMVSFASQRLRIKYLLG